MKITKLGHCCLLIKDQEVTLLTDPGAFSDAQNSITGINAILITHEHADHLHVDSLKQVLKNNPEAMVITNQSVGNILDKEEILYTVVADGQSIDIGSVHIEGKGTTHAEIYSEITPVENTGYFISNKLFYPGDALYNPGQPVDVLALPVVGPWLKTSEVIDYALAVNPKKVFPVHDGMLNDRGVFYHKTPERFLTQAGIAFVYIKPGEEIEF